MSKGKARDYIPALAYGHKILPSDLAGMLGLPYVGDIWYVDATNGSDTNDGTTKANAFATLGTAYTACTDNAHDVIIVSPGEVASGSGTSEASAITWAKDQIHVVGSAAPVHVSQRSRIIFTTDATDPCLTISGQGNTFQNIQIATYQASNDVLVSLTGNRNYFSNVHFGGIGHATAGDDASARCVSMSGAEECRFQGCTFGFNTVAMSTTNALVEMASATTRILFEDCIFNNFADNAGALWVKCASAADVDRYAIFKNCAFHNAVDSTATTMTTGFSINAAVGGTIILLNSWMRGATDWADDFTNVYIDMGKPDTDEGGILLVAS